MKEAIKMKTTYYKFKIEVLNKDNEVTDVIECRTRKEVKNTVNSYNFPLHYRTIKTKNNKMIKSLTKLHKIDTFTF